MSPVGSAAIACGDPGAAGAPSDVWRRLERLVQKGNRGRYNQTRLSSCADDFSVTSLEYV